MVFILVQNIIHIMKNKFLIGLILFANLMHVQVGIQEAPYFFIQLSDTQFGMFENNTGFQKETELYEKAHLTLHPEPLLMCGRC
jgi:hypothetical protein